jgi:hypothetical protein
VHSKSFDDHIVDVMKTIDIIKEHKLKLKKQKCVFFATEVKL